MNYIRKWTALNKKILKIELENDKKVEITIIVENEDERG